MVRRMAAGLALVSALVVGWTAAAFADTATSSATAVSTVFSGSPSSVGRALADNAGGGPTQLVVEYPPLQSVLPLGIIIGASLTQAAVANGDGSAGACAGAVSAGGSVTLDPSGSCSVVAGPGNLLLGGPNLLIQAQAIVGSCTSTSRPLAAGATTMLTGFQATGSNAGPLAGVGPTPAPNTTIQLPGVGTLTLNAQSGGRLTAFSLTYSTPYDHATEIAIGTVSCWSTPAAGVPVVGSASAAGVAAIPAAAACAALGLRRHWWRRRVGA